MTVAKALSFIRRALVDEGFRKKLNYSQTPEQLSNILDGENFSFSYPEFDEAFYLWLVKCQDAAEAEQLMEFQAWWVMLNQWLADQNCAQIMGVN